MCGDDPPTCECCGLPLSVRYILVECVGLRDIRTKYLTVSSVGEQFHTIINFIEEAHFYTQTVMSVISILY